MKGDFTRGIQPDGKRGKRYRRVLVQQSRVLLDSDVAALVDSVDRELRQQSSDLGCRLGSPDLGYLITPGRLLALFEHTDAVSSSGAGSALRDYSRKYPSAPEDRYPSLRIQAVTATIPLVEPLRGAFNGQLALWYRADAALSITVTAGSAVTVLNLPLANVWTRATANITVAAGVTLSELAIAGAAAPIWIGLIELHEDRGPGPHFWAAAGRFHAQGLTPELRAASGYPALSYPTSAGFGVSDAELTALANGSRIVAYLESWERGISAIEDPGIREAALGKVDTTLRSEVKGQIKWASAGALTAEQLRRAFRRVAGPSSRLEVQAPTTPPSSDPCALPTSGGYTGADHRLYRFEVHAGGAPLSTQIKWSRDNGAQLFPVLARSGAIVTLERASGLADGDLVEILSEAVDLADSARASVGVGGVVPATRQVGLLARLKQEEADNQGRDRFTLIDRLAPPATIDPGTDLARYPAAGSALRLRRWDGVAAPRAQGAAVVASIEDGIEITLAGAFRVGEYWQFEARRGASNDNGPWQSPPHGPERILAPLALLTLPAGTQPALLEAWLDDRFSSLCELDADDIVFDGDRIDSDADTVQEALEELYERDAGNCCDATLGPNGAGDDAPRIQAALAALTFPDGGQLCLEPGVYDIGVPIVIDRDVVIRGCPDATLIARGQGPIFRITRTGRLRLGQLVLYNGPEPTAFALVELLAGGRLAAREVGFLAGGRGEGGGVAIYDPAAPIQGPDFQAGDDPAIDPDQLPPSDVEGSSVQLEDSVVLAWFGVWAVRLRELSAQRTAFVSAGERGGIAAQQLDHLRVTECSFRGGLPDDFFVGVDPAFVRGQSDDLLERAAQLPGVSGWGIAVRHLLGGLLSNNYLRCGTGLWARVARDLTIREDIVDALDSEHGSWGIRMHHARRVNLQGLRIAASIGIEVPLSARQLSVANCFLRTSNRALTFAGEHVELHNAGAFVGVLIQGNQIETPLEGVAVGASGTRAAEVDDVRVVGNVLRSSGGPSTATSILVIGDNDLASAIVVEGNEITTDRVGIRVAGSGGVVRNNQIRLSSNNGPAITAFGTAGIGQIAVADNVVSGVNNSFTAIELLGTPDVSVTGNQVRTTAARHVLDNPAALHISGSSAALRQYVVGNDFAVGSCRIDGASNLDLVGNTLRILLVDSGASGRNGVIHGNQIGAILIFIIPVSASLTNLRGMWKISDNLAPGPVVIQGATHQEIVGFNFLASAAKYNTIADGLAKINVPKETLALMFGGTSNTAAAPAAGAAAAAREVLAPRRKRVTESYAAEADAGILVEEIYAEAGYELAGPLNDYLVENELALATITVVEPFDFHVSGNRFGWLTVGPADGQTPELSSSLHVVDNKVDLTLTVSMLSGLTLLDNVVAMNSGKPIDAPVISSTAAIRGPNLLL